MVSFLIFFFGGVLQFSAAWECCYIEFLGDTWSCMVHLSAGKHTCGSCSCRLLLQTHFWDLGAWVLLEVAAEAKPPTPPLVDSASQRRALDLLPHNTFPVHHVHTYRKEEGGYYNVIIIVILCINNMHSKSIKHTSLCTDGRFYPGHQPAHKEADENQWRFGQFLVS